MLSDAGATMLARVGFAARGLVYLLIGWFAVDAALRGGETADNQGAIGSLADESYGPALLAVVALGLFGYALWRLTEAAAGPAGMRHDGKANFNRLGHAISGIAHLVLAWTATKLALRAGGSGADASPGDEAARDWTTWLLSQPLGQLLVGIVAIGFIAAALQQAKRAWKADFVDELAGDTPTPGYVCTAGRIGYAARGIVFAVIAGFFVLAAWRSEAEQAGGMADALGTLQDQPGGQFMLVAMGAGLALFGVFSFVEAKYRRIRVRLPG